MAQGNNLASRKQEKVLPYWSQALRALRDARGITQDGWAAHLGYGRATIRRWEAGQTVPSADAEAAIIALCTERRLFRTFTDGPLAGVNVTPEWIADLLAAARLNPDQAPPVRPAPDPMPAAPPVFYALSDDVAIAYQVIGDGPIDIVVVPGAVSHREIDWEHPGFRSFLDDLSGVGRVIVFDKRGTGMSDRVPTGTMEERMDDIRAVMDAAGSARAAIIGISEGGPLSILFATTWPKRVSALVLYGTYGRVPAPSPDVPLQPFEHLQQAWGTPHSGFLDRFGPSAATDPGEREWWARLQRMSASPGAVRDLNRMNANLDVRSVLTAIHVPTLVLHRAGDRVTYFAEGQDLARRIPGAQLIELPGNDHLPWLGDVAALTGEITYFLRHSRFAPPVDTILATVVCATEGHPARLGALRTIAAQEFARWRGKEAPPAESDIVATFDGATRAVRAARSLRKAACAAGLEPRIGVHTGEIHLQDDEISGTTVDITRTLAHTAAPGEILISGTVTDLVTDASITFTPDGTNLRDTVAANFRVCRVDGTSS